MRKQHQTKEALTAFVWDNNHQFFYQENHDQPFVEKNDEQHFLILLTISPYT
jgi:hypothetical protein